MKFFLHKSDDRNQKHAIFDDGTDTFIDAF